MRDGVGGSTGHPPSPPGKDHPLFEAALEALSALPCPGARRVLVLTGDLVHRGPDSLGTLALASQAAERFGFDAQVWLAGHHELLLLDALDALDINRPQTRAVEEWLDAGGAGLLAELDPEWHAPPVDWPGLGHRLAARLPMVEGFPLRQVLRRAPSALRMGDVVFVHAGVDPSEPLDIALARPQSSHRAHRLGPYGLVDAHAHWAWVRAPFLEHTGGFFDEYGEPVLIAHGHSPARGAHYDWLDAPNGALAKGLDRGLDLGRIILDGGIARPGGFLAGAVFAGETVRLLGVA